MRVTRLLLVFLLTAYSMAEEGLAAQTVTLAEAVTLAETGADIPQVACRLTSRSPDFARWTSVFRAERRLRSRKRLELGGSGREPAASFPGSDVFQRGGQTCRASFVEFWPISRLRA